MKTTPLFGLHCSVVSSRVSSSLAPNVGRVLRPSSSPSLPGNRVGRVVLPETLRVASPLVGHWWCLLQVGAGRENRSAREIVQPPPDNCEGTDLRFIKEFVGATDAAIINCGRLSANKRVLSSMMRIFFLSLQRALLGWCYLLIMGRLSWIDFCNDRMFDWECPTAQKLRRWR